jgi:hypothetical protein
VSALVAPASRFRVNDAREYLGPAQVQRRPQHSLFVWFIDHGNDRQERGAGALRRTGLDYVVKLPRKCERRISEAVDEVFTRNGPRAVVDLQAISAGSNSLGRIGGGIVT